MKKAILFIAFFIALVLMVADMPNASLVQIALVKGFAGLMMFITARLLERYIPEEEV